MHSRWDKKRKRMGHTVLNAESSRSHSVFNIRLVQAPIDFYGEHIVQDKCKITVSQLSLVDLAGSERISRTKNTGLRLREAGNINNSLMTLRTCLEYLRENQKSNNTIAQKKVPYRDSKITHLFKNYFEGEGQVSMILCINPRAEDFDENTQVMKFAEMSQEVQIARAKPLKPVLGLTPGRRKANKIFKIALNNLNTLGYDNTKDFEIDIGLLYTLGPNFPKYKIESPNGEYAIQELMKCLMQRIEKRKLLCADLENRYDNFRFYIIKTEKENLQLRTELASLHTVNKQERERSFALENKLRVHESSIDVLNKKINNRERQIDELTRKLNELENELTKKEQEQEKQKKKFTSKLAVEVDKKDRELETKLREQKAKLEEKVRLKDEKLRLVSNLIQDISLVHPNSSENLFERKQSITDQVNQCILLPSESMNTGYNTQRNIRGMAAANTRHRRSRSVGEKWIEHRAPNPVPLGTILQPYLKNRKSVTKLNEMKDLTGHKATKYCLVSQDADTDGDVETKLYKGNLIPTCGGGAQVVFEDVECLKQKSPVTSPNLKRPNACNNGTTLSGVGMSAVVSNPSIVQDVASRCNVGIEGHSKRSKM